MWWKSTKQGKNKIRIFIFVKVVDVFSHVCFSIVCFCDRYLVWNIWDIIVYDFYSLVCCLTMKMNWRLSLWTKKCEQPWCFRCWITKDSERMNSRLRHHFLMERCRLLLWRILTMALTRGSGQSWHRPTPVHTLMLTCIWSAVAAWRHSLCVCTEVAMCEFVHYMQVCACVCHQSVSPRQQHHMHAPVTAQTCRPRQQLTTPYNTHTLQELYTILHIVLSAACHSAWRLCSMSTFLL